MSSLVLLLLLLLLLTLATLSSQQPTKTCPVLCTCTLDSHGRQLVTCVTGGQVSSLSPYFTDLSTSTEVLVISAPADNMNSLTMSPEFQNYRDLQEINITRSNIPILGMHFFYSLKRLKVLNLSQNNITQTLDHNFRGLVGLNELYLDDNRISSLPSGTFRYLKDLKVLSLQRNRFQVMMPRMFEELKKLRVLRMSGNNLGTLNPEVFNDIKELRELECRGCALTTINPEIYAQLKQLTHLDLGDNDLVHISADEFHHMVRLQHLKLDGNRFELIPDKTFIRQSQLKSLTLARNAISKVSVHAFDHLSNLTDLDLGYNNLDPLKPNVLNPVANRLERLVLSGNPLTVEELHGILKNMQHLNELDLQEVGLKELPSNFVPEKVTKLNLAQNQLSYIPGDFVTGNIVDLDLSRNIFRGLDEETIDKLEHVHKLNLDGNPWSCDLCHILPMHQATNKSTLLYNVRCQTPYHHANKLLGTLRREHLSLCTSSSYSSESVNFFLARNEGTIGVIAAGASICLLFLTALAVLVALIYTRRHAAKYYTHEDKRTDHEREAIFESSATMPPFPEELSFKFPLDTDVTIGGGGGEKKIYVATIDEIKKDHDLQSNGIRA